MAIRKSEGEGGEREREQDIKERKIWPGEGRDGGGGGMGF